jgi:hypothetical protein
LNEPSKLSKISKISLNFVGYKIIIIKKNSRTVATHVAGTQKARVHFCSMGEDLKETQ